MNISSNCAAYCTGAGDVAPPIFRGAVTPPSQEPVVAFLVPPTYKLALDPSTLRRMCVQVFSGRMAVSVIERLLELAPLTFCISR